MVVLVTDKCGESFKISTIILTVCHYLINSVLCIIVGIMYNTFVCIFLVIII